MNSIYISLITFGCVSAGIVVGLFLHAALPTNDVQLTKERIGVPTRR